MTYEIKNVEYYSTGSMQPVLFVFICPHQLIFSLKDAIITGKETGKEFCRCSDSVNSFAQILKSPCSG